MQVPPVFIDMSLEDQVSIISNSYLLYKSFRMILDFEVIFVTGPRTSSLFEESWS